MKREGEDWKRQDWHTTTDEIGSRLRAIVDRHGPRSIATYWGNAADSIGITISNTFCHGAAGAFSRIPLHAHFRCPKARELQLLDP